MKIEIIKTCGTQPWRFRVRASNGEILVWSEKYARKAGMMKAIKSLTEGLVAGAEIVRIDVIAETRERLSPANDSLTPACDT